MKLLLTLASFASYAFGGVVDCGGLFKITELSQSPDTYVRGGDNTTLTLKYDVPETWTPLEGTTTTSISLNGLPLTPSVDEICKSVKCPITHGSHDGSSWTTFPSGVTGKIVSKVVWKDTNNVQLLCLQSTFKAEAGTYSSGSVNMLKVITTANRDGLPPSLLEANKVGFQAGQGPPGTTLTAKPLNKKCSYLDPYYNLYEESSSSTSGSSSKNSTSTRSSSSGSGRKLRGGK